MKVTLKYAEKQARYWAKKAAKMGSNQRSNQGGSNHEKEKEKKEEASPRTPYKEKKVEEKDNQPLPPARARMAVIDLSRPPTLDELLTFAHSRGYNDDNFIRKWFDQMENELFWRYPKNGLPLNHWVAYFRRCYQAEHAPSKSSTFSRPRRGISQTANYKTKEVATW